MQSGGDVGRENSRGFQAEDRADALASSEDAVAHGLMNRSWARGFLREEALQCGVDGEAVVFKECGEFHCGGSGMGHESRAGLKLRSLSLALFLARRARRRVFRRLFSAESRRGLRPLRAASGTRGKAPHLPRIISWLRPVQVAGFPGGGPLLRGARGTFQNRASWAAQVFLQALSSLEHFLAASLASSILRHVLYCKQSYINGMESRRGLQGQNMLPRIHFGEVAEGLVDWAALVPIGKLVGVVGAAGLTGLAAGDEHDGLIPICEVGDKTHGWAVMFSGGTRTVGGAGLRLVRDAQKMLEQAGAAERMHDIQRIKLFPGPVADARFVTYLREAGHRAVGCCGQQIIVGFVCGWQPLRGAVR